MSLGHTDMSVYPMLRYNFTVHTIIGGLCMACDLSHLRLAGLSWQSLTWPYGLGNKLKTEFQKHATLLGTIGLATQLAWVSGS